MELLINPGPKWLLSFPLAPKQWHNSSSTHRQRARLLTLSLTRSLLNDRSIARLLACSDDDDDDDDNVVDSDLRAIDASSFRSIINNLLHDT